MLGYGGIIALNIKRYEMEMKMKKEFNNVELIEQTDGSYKVSHNFILERKDLGHRLSAKLIIELPDEKLRLSREQVKEAIIEHSTHGYLVVLEALGFSE